MEEIFDIVDENGEPTGETVARSIAHDKGILHRTSHIWVIRKEQGRWQVLLQKRSMEKDSFPGGLDTSSAGHITAGDDPLHAARRELFEELGIDAGEDGLTPVGTFRISYEAVFRGKPFRDNEVTFVYVYDKPVDVKDLVLQKSEVDAADWYDFLETVERVRTRDERYVIPSSGLRTLGGYLGYDMQVLLPPRPGKDRKETVFGRRDE